ncbi:hypothetical protein LX15_001743 [Streptoalloteichus tenebrarius]|uniref:Uncharacterized protein n=1 Tax=Streptoalloteichus tenebrarius (strain ATCC 17920 / DSM 40477 / JCM 4838 / CBS 697.72 / NBRC 16177 / NCIMB 11028 / NRRL B-12390 / A12253. 1 / ISP 5477) TaxID=1933 RepID=A0ABT1HRA9_STRSD|nr:hypothetical protein [Streptoalloteichus tenebrarius]MCP2258056.1 hypothetical protein [Streptoalloteichus tenebrarius]BFF01727.1 hypothetical protein GCM10020241_34020 [Streptoalloteichus tenebrarius]
MRVRAQFLVATASVVAGVGVLLAPAADGTRPPGLPWGHGPSSVDLLGLAGVGLGLAWLVALVVRYLPAVRRRLGDRPLFVLALLGGFGLGSALVSVLDGGPWWAPGLVVASLASVTLGAALASASPG